MPSAGMALNSAVMALNSAVVALTSAVSRPIVVVVYDDLRSVSDELVASAGRLARCDQ